MTQNKIKLNTKKNNTKVSNKWILIIIMLTILISGGISFLSDMLLNNVTLLVAFIILIFIILLGIVFDIIGVAVTAADETPFHAMASKKIPGAKISIRLIRNADRVSNICNDVIGDVSGIVSGSMGALIIAKMVPLITSPYMAYMSILVSALIAALTVGGKSVGKTIAINNANQIIYNVSRLIYLIKKDK